MLQVSFIATLRGLVTLLLIKFAYTGKCKCKNQMPSINDWLIYLKNNPVKFHHGLFEMMEQGLPDFRNRNTGDFFSARQHNAVARYMLSPARPSVSVSVTRVDQSKTVDVRIMQLSPQSSAMTLVSSRLTSALNIKGNIGSGGAE